MSPAIKGNISIFGRKTDELGFGHIEVEVPMEQLEFNNLFLILGPVSCYPRPIHQTHVDLFLNPILGFLGQSGQ